jgi:hypothetical protein
MADNGGVKSAYTAFSNLKSDIENFTYLLPTKFQFIWLRGFRGED